MIVCLPCGTYIRWQIRTHVLVYHLIQVPGFTILSYQPSIFACSSFGESEDLKYIKCSLSLPERKSSIGRLKRTIKGLVFYSFFYLDEIDQIHHVYSLLRILKYFSFLSKKFKQEITIFNISLGKPQKRVFLQWPGH